MCVNKMYATFVVALGTSLGGCGGGSNSGSNGPIAVVPAPTPTSSPTPGPSPSPSPTSNANVTALQVDQTFTTPYGRLEFLRSAEDSYGGEAHASGGSAQHFSYVAATKSFRVADITGTKPLGQASPVINFSESERVSAASDAHQTLYMAAVNSYDYELTLFNPGAANDLLALTYSSIGLTRQSKSGPLRPYPDAKRFYSHAFSYGIVTPTIAPSPGGTVTYRGIIMGEAVDAAPGFAVAVYKITGTINVTVNFATGTNDGQMVLVGTDERTGRRVEVGTFDIVLNGNNSLTGNGGAAGVVYGDAAFSYYGPRAEELSGAAGLSIAGSTLIPSFPENQRLSLSLAFASKR